MDLQSGAQGRDARTGRVRGARWAGLMASAVLLVWLAAVVAPSYAAEGEPKGGDRKGPELSDIVVQGKLFCSLKRQVVLPFKGAIDSLKVRIGQAVKEGEVLARYRLAPDVAQQLRRRLAAPQLIELEGQLAEAEKSLSSLQAKHREIKQLVAQNMAPAQGLDQLDREIQLVKKHSTALKDRLQLEKKLAADETDSMKVSLGGSIEAVRGGGEASLTAPIAGHVIWIQPDLREGSEIQPGVAAFVIGVMEPMVMKAQIHELEAVRVAPGDRAQVRLESLPDRTFDGTVSRLSWAPMSAAVEQPTYYEMELTVPNPGLVLREGMKGEIVFHKSK